MLCVRWYVSYKLSYRDLAEMMLERGIQVAPSTICRWVQRYIPEFEKRWDRFSRPVGNRARTSDTKAAVHRAGPGPVPAHDLARAWFAAVMI